MGGKKIENTMSRLSSILVVFLLCVAFVYAVKFVDVNTICKKAKNHSFCSALLNSNPSKSRDLVSLALYTIHVGHINATNALNLSDTLVAKSSHDLEAYTYYSVCSNDFKEIVNILKVAQVDLKSKNYKYLSIHVENIRTHVSNCIDAKYPIAYPDPSLLPKYAAIVDQDAQIFSIIANYLGQA
ncbi:pectinesterase inhibitor 2-like [Trifolium pratense]|uniref:pectinesterase inhibitor 2-like n=1 Tax=Trifolium pratense TaxID=57577 RepID=UPI001E696B27|nr:pectinesterase inhibitor 2-like [Trifolium pratense]